MSNRKSVFSSRFSFSSALVLLTCCIGSLSIANEGRATPVPDAPRIQPTTPAVTQLTPNKHPVIIAILEKLGVKQVISEPVSQPASSPQLTVIEKLKMAYDAENRTPAKSAPPSSPKKLDPSKKRRKNNQTDAFADFYTRPYQQPLWVSRRGILKTTHRVLKEFEHADRYGLRPKDFAITLPIADGGTLSPSQLAGFELKMSAAAIKYAAYARGNRIDPRTLSRFQDRGPVLPEPEMVLSTLDESDHPFATLRSFHPQHPQFKALRKKLVEQLTKGKQIESGIKSNKSTTEKQRAQLLINMERWRWMPDKMQGNNNIFVWANVPELKVRIVKEGKTVFYERVIAGKRAKQSPMFSDKMEWIEFNPTWFIPNSIKVADILPSLRRKGRVMSRYHLRLDCGKHGTDYSKIDWRKVDIRKCSIIQPTGAKSVLGKLKFKFPNKHAVYMHDTLTPNLFNRKHRILSHGCIRVRDPRRMAEILLANDKGMSAKRIGNLLARGGLHTEHLKRSIPVHITYFSSRVNKNGALTHHPDYYGHDKRLAQALLGKGHLFKGAVYGASSRARRKRTPRKPKPKATLYQQIFANQ